MDVINLGHTSVRMDLCSCYMVADVTVPQLLMDVLICSVGVCLPGGLWAEISNFAECASDAVHSEKRVAIRRRERCAAAMTATRAIYDTSWLERWDLSS